jgi:hypothetical protein
MHAHCFRLVGRWSWRTCGRSTRRHRRARSTRFPGNRGPCTSTMCRRCGSVLLQCRAAKMIACAACSPCSGRSFIPLPYPLCCNLAAAGGGHQCQPPRGPHGPPAGARRRGPAVLPRSPGRRTGVRRIREPVQASIPCHTRRGCMHGCMYSCKPYPRCLCTSAHATRQDTFHCRSFPDAVTVRCFAFEPSDAQMQQDTSGMAGLLMFPPGDWDVCTQAEFCKPAWSDFDRGASNPPVPN